MSDGNPPPAITAEWLTFVLRFAVAGTLWTLTAGIFLMAMVPTSSVQLPAGPFAILVAITLVFTVATLVTAKYADVRIRRDPM